MKNKIQSYVGMRLGGCRLIDTLTTHLSPTNHPLKHGIGKYIFSFLLVLAMSIGQMWADVTLFTADFSAAAWDGVTFSQGNTDNYDVINGITFHSKNSSKQFSISGGVLTWPNNNMSSNNYYLGFPVTGINEGSITISVWDGSTATRVKYVVKNNEDAFSANIGSSGTNTNSASPTTVTVSSLGTKAFVYLGRQGSGLTTITKIVVTTPNPSCAAGDPGNISKGTLVGGELTLTVTGSPASGDTWYWQAAEDGTSKTNDAASISVDAAGTYYIRSYNTAGDCWSDAKSITIASTDLVENYTVVYKDGTTELGSEVVAVGDHPAGIADPTKDCYTFAGWMNGSTPVADVTALSGTADEEIELTATWTPVYSSSATLISDANVSAKANVNTVFAASNIVSSITFTSGNYEFTSNETKPGYYGYKDKNSGDYMKILLKKGKRAQVLFGNLGADPTITVNGVAKSLDAARATGDMAENTFTWIAAEDALIVITMGSGTNTLKKVDIVQLYTATRVDGKSDGAGSDANVLETTLPTPTAISGWTFTGWVADQDVKAGAETKTASTILPAGTYTLLANTTFTAQWAEASSTYDITYVSAHGTAPDAENAASVVLAELSADGWAHKGWTANADVTVDAATVDAGDIIANGKTAILASDVEFTAVWKEVFTVSFNSKDGSAVAPIDVEDGASLAAAPANPTKDNYVFLGWSETDGGDVVADITAITISADKTFFAKWALDVQVSEIVFSNSFKGWINGSTVEVFYMAGESAPTIVSYDGKNLKAEGGVVISGDKIIATGTDDSEKEYALTMTAVTPLTATGTQTFDGSEGYVKTRHAWASDKKWKMSRYAEDGRVARGETSMYIFLGAAENVTFSWSVQKVAEDVEVYVNGTYVKKIGKNNNSAIELSNGNNMVAFYSIQTSGDIGISGLTTTPWVPVTAVALKEGEDPISSKEIWASTNFTLTAEVTPDNASNKTITWTSSNDAIATVVNGVVTGVAANASPVTITASTVDGVTATCEVTVTAAPEPSAAPVITTQPADGNYYEEATIAALEVVATGESLSYQWYLGSDAIDGAIAATYTPTVSAIGSYVYHCVVTNTEAGKLPTSLASDNATITIAEDPSAIKLLNGSTVNTTNFITGVTAEKVTISEVEYDCVKFSGTVSDVNGVKDLTRVIAYNATTNQTKIKLSLYNNSTSSRTVQVKGLVEGATEAVDLAAIELGNKEQKVSDWITFNNASNRTIYIFIGSSAGDVRFLQVKVLENGATPMKQAGEAGYSLNFNKGRFFGVKDVTAHFEGMNVEVASSDCQPLNTSVVKLNESSISFDVAAPLTLSVTTNNNKTYYVTKDAAGTDNETAKAGVSEFNLTAGTWFITGGASNVEITNIAFTAPKCAEPTIDAQPVTNVTFGAGNLTASVTAHVNDGGTLSYQWYNASDDSEVTGADEATLTTTTEGTYYVIVTNTLADHQANSTKSDEATLRYRTLNDATLSSLSYGDPETAIALEADKYEYRVILNEGTVDVPALHATATMNPYPAVTITNAASFTDYTAQSTVHVMAEDGVTELTYTVNFIVKHIYTSLEDVTGSTTWNWIGSVDQTIDDVPNKGEIIANYIEGDNFEMIEGKAGEYARRTQNGGVYQGTYLHFNTTVPGRVKFYFRAPSSGENCTITVKNGGRTVVAGTRGNSFGWSDEVFVNGDVVIEMVNDKEGGGTTRVQQVVFTAADPDYTRDVTEGRYGTICLPKAGVMVGATLYEIAYYGATSEKIFFDDIPTGEMEAGVPYVFLPNEGVSELGVYYTADVVEPAYNRNGLHGFIGASEDEYYDIPAGDDNYIIQNNQYRYVPTGAWARIKSNRAFIHLTDITHVEPALAPGRKRMSIGAAAPQITTGMDELNAAEAPVKVLINGELFILRGEKMYDATGRLVK